MAKLMLYHVTTAPLSSFIDHIPLTLTNIDNGSVLGSFSESQYRSLDIGSLSHALMIPKSNPSPETSSRLILTGLTDDIKQKDHTVNVHELPDEYPADALPIAKKIALAQGLENYNILQNNGRLAHQEVDHVHFHVIQNPPWTNSKYTMWNCP
ncbi:hypothetical protein J3R82DRAFT_10088 [Butyriboletus roseoflavus]|nr:hypothetical protein J3R82DRAFT_10088 [Butyriboletus roseoflavus]